MKGITEVVWHGRGGQGAVTAAKLLGEAALREGKNLQAFPEFGAERTGAPVRSFTRLSDKPITIHCSITAADCIVVLDPTLIDVVDITEGMKDDTSIVINTVFSAKEIREKLGIKGGKIFTVDATSISVAKVGRNIPNMPMVGALLKATGLIKLESLTDTFKESFAAKFTPEVIKGNLEAIEQAYKEVKAE
ncbi:MAG: 2-oxoacid:acceptor oxidoreductase family protein [Candidatus Omnitrophota bacterium]|jgi:pyruvate ferredoxin oxidoreductase gamma subunit